MSEQDDCAKKHAELIEEWGKRHVELMDAYDRLASAVWGEEAPAIGAAEHERAAEALRARAIKAEADLQDALQICEDLCAVFDARFAAAMNGEEIDQLDKGIFPETVAREKEAVAYAIERHGETFKALRSRAEKAEAEVTILRGVLDRAHAHSLEMLGLSDDGEVLRLREQVSAANERAKQAEIESADANSRLANLESVVLNAVQKMSAAQADLTAARALLREVVDSVAECVNLPACSDPDEPMARSEWCQFCDISARIEAHLEGR